MKISRKSLIATIVRNVYWYFTHKIQESVISVCLSYEESFELGATKIVHVFLRT